VDSIDDDIKGQIWKILENNMHSMYAQVIYYVFSATNCHIFASLQRSSFGWNSREKKNETFQEDARFLLYTHKLPEGPKVVGFSMFRFEGDDEGPSGETESVLYWCATCHVNGITALLIYTASIHSWELQAATEFQGLGVGTALLNALRCLAKKCEMQKIMLTVLKGDNAIHWNFRLSLDVAQQTIKRGLHSTAKSGKSELASIWICTHPSGI